MSIIVDLSSHLHANLAVAINQAGNIDNCDVDFFRHLILNSILNIRTRFKDEYSESDLDFILALDSSPSWRKVKYPTYKAGRKITRDASGINWKAIFNTFNKIMDEIIEYLPYITVRVDMAEADDIIYTLLKNSPWPKPESIMFGDDYESKNLIVSNDKDLRAAHKFGNTTQFFPRKKIVEKEPFPDEFLERLVLCGDVSDGVPNVRSDIDTLIDKSKRQLPITQKYIDKCFSTNYKCLTEEEQKRLEENRELIDMENIPQEIQNNIIDEYRRRVEQKPKRNKLLTYFMTNNLNRLTEKIHLF